MPVKLLVDQWFYFFLSFLDCHHLSAHCSVEGWLLFQLITLSDMHSLGRTPLDEGPPKVETHATLKTDIHATGRFRTHDPSKRTDSDPRLRPLGF